jgi:3-hydroxyanthranilate 3,4-dioxygenase
MAIARPFNLQAWVEEHRHLLKPPVGNQQVYKGNDDYIVMIVGGPNSRKDYHYNEGEELFYQLEGDIVVKVIEDGQPVDSPQRKANTVGLVIERYRKNGEKDGFMWFCENCNNKLYEEYLEVSDIVKQLPVVMNNFFASEELRTCSACGTVMQPPK